MRITKALVIALTPLLFAFDIAPGILFSYQEYREQPLNIDVTEWTMTGKVSLRQSLLENWLTAEGDISGTLLTLSHAPIEEESSRFLAFSGAIEMRLPFSEASPVQAAMALGWSFWEMYVPLNRYGISAISSPFSELRLSGLFPPLRKITVFARFAPIISRSGKFNFDNREWSAGLIYDVMTQPTPSRNVNLILEAKQTHLQSVTLDNRSEIFSILAGIQSFL